MLTNLPKGKKAIGYKWVYKVKFKPTGEVNRFKAYRFKAYLVATCYSQIEGLDYKDRFSPVAKLTTVRIFINLVTFKQWPIFQLDINNAFLHSYLNEELYIVLPQDYKKALLGQLCLLKWSLYGFK